MVLWNWRVAQAPVVWILGQANWRSRFKWSFSSFPEAISASKVLVEFPCASTDPEGCFHSQRGWRGLKAGRPTLGAAVENCVILPISWMFWLWVGFPKGCAGIGVVILVFVSAGFQCFGRQERREMDFEKKNPNNKRRRACQRHGEAFGCRSPRAKLNWKVNIDFKFQGKMEITKEILLQKVASRTGQWAGASLQTCLLSQQGHIPSSSYLNRKPTAKQTTQSPSWPQHWPLEFDPFDHSVVLAAICSIAHGTEGKMQLKWAGRKDLDVWQGLPRSMPDIGLGISIFPQEHPGLAGAFLGSGQLPAPAAISFKVNPPPGLSYCLGSVARPTF